MNFSELSDDTATGQYATQAFIVPNRSNNKAPIEEWINRLMYKVYGLSVQ